MNLEQEKELIERAKTSAPAFGELYELYYSPIFGYVLRRTGSLEAAQDVTSDVFFKALNNLNRFQWRSIPFSAWLYRIANHEVANYHRDNGRRPFPIESDADLTAGTAVSVDNELIEAEVELEKHESFLALHAGISTLPVKYQEVITLRFFENKQLNEIGIILGKREGTVKSLLHRGLEKLRKNLQENATFS